MVRVNPKRSVSRQTANRILVVPRQLTSFQSMHPRMVAVAPVTTLVKLANETHRGENKLSSYLNGIQKGYWIDGVEPFASIHNDGLEFGKFFVLLPTGGPILMTFIGERDTIESLRPGQKFELIHNGKRKQAELVRFLTSHHDLMDTFEDSQRIITVEARSIKHSSARPGHHVPYTGSGFQINITISNPNERGKGEKKA